MRYGRGAPPAGFLPVYSVDTEDEARALLAATCPRNRKGEFVAPELAEEQTLERLYEFAERLEQRHEQLKENETWPTKIPRPT